MSLHQYHVGPKAAIYEYRDEKKPGCLTEFFSARRVPEKAQDKMEWLMLLFCEKGEITNDQHFKFLEDGIYEFKPKNFRILCFFLEGQPEKCVVATTYFRKQTNKTPRKEIEKAKLIRSHVEKEIGYEKAK